MGLFFKKNKGDINPKEDELKCLVTNYLGHNAVIKMNGKLNVPNGYEFVIGKRGKVLDKFTEGEHFFSYANLPYSCRKYRIDKIENGKQKDSFTCELYFVDKGLRAGKFKTYRKVEMGTRAYGLFKAGVYGMYTYKVVNSHEFMQSLLNEFDYIKTGEAEDIVAGWVDDLVVSVLEKNNFMLTDVVANSPIIAEKLKIAIGKLFTVAGLEIVDVEIYKYKLPKEYQEESDKNIANQQAIKQGRINDIEQANTTNENQTSNSDANNDESNKENLDVDMQEENQKDNKEQSFADELKAFQDENLSMIYTKEELQEREKAQKVQNQTSEEPANEPTSQIDDQTKEETNQTTPKEDKPQDSYVPFGNFVITKEENFDAEEIKNRVKNEENKPKERTFVDLNLDKLYDNEKQQTKRCLRCGGENDINADHCILCGEKFYGNDE
mgnify:FL=1